MKSKNVQGGDNIIKQGGGSHKTKLICAYGVPCFYASLPPCNGSHSLNGRLWIGICSTNAAICATFTPSLVLHPTAHKKSAYKVRARVMRVHLEVK